MQITSQLRDLVLEWNLPEPDYGFAIAPGVVVLMGYPDDRAGVVTAPLPAAEAGWRLFACDPGDASSVRSAAGALAAHLGYGALGDQPAPGAPAAHLGHGPSTAAAPSLTSQQIAAVHHGDGPARILAGAGTGKTTVSVARFHHLVERGVAPDRILVLTFSREAARDMRAKILRRLDATAQLWVSTFHSFCLKVLEAEGARRPRLVQEAECRAFLEVIAANYTWRWYAGARAPLLTNEAFEFIGQAKDHLLTPEQVAAYAAHQADDRLHDLAEAYRLFQLELAAQNAAEFSDFIYEAVTLLEGRPEAAARWQALFDHILVDEFQDTNLAQFRVLQALAQPHGNLVVVGDDDQAIYRFRGATDRFMVRFPAYLPGAQDYKVEENFRCPAPVLELANRLIAENGPERVAKTLYTTTTTTDTLPARHLEARTDREEAEAVALEIGRRLRQGRRPDEFVILCRSVRRSGDAFARALSSLNIPYRLVGEEREHPAVSQTLALLRLLAGTASAEDALQVLAALLSPQELYAAVRTALGQGVAPTEPWDAAHTEGALPPRVSGAQPPLPPGNLPLAVRHWLLGPAGAQVAAALQEQAPAWAQRPLAEQVYEALKFLGHLRLFLRPSPADLDRLAAVRALQEQAAAATSLADLHSRISPRPDRSVPAVTIMTVHAAKGLEFPVAFVTGLAEGRFPVSVDAAPVYHTAEVIRDWLDTGTATEPDGAQRLAQHMREERRLAYVALTRAQEELILTRAHQYGGEPAEPSRFLAEMGAPTPEAVSGWLGDPLPLARSYLVRVATGAEQPLPDRVQAAAHLLQANPDAVPLRRQASPTPYTADESLHLSATSLETYRDCPRRYYYARVLGLAEEENIYLAFGGAVHAALDRFNRARLGGGAPTWPELERWWEEEMRPEPFETAGQYQQLLARGRLFLRRYHAWAIAQTDEVVAVEQAFSVPYVDRHGRTHTLRGRYDLILRTPSGLEIVDYKTGHRKSTGVNKRRARSANDPERKLQLGLYYLAYFGGGVQPGARITYRFLRHVDDAPPATFVNDFNAKGEQVISCEHTAETLAAIRDSVDEIIDAILANRFERTDDTSKCRNCPFRAPCEVSPHDWF